MPQRRRVFDSQYGSAKSEQAKPEARLPPPMGGPPVPLSLAPQQAQGQAQGPVQASGGPQLPPNFDQMLQQLLAQFRGAHG